MFNKHFPKPANISTLKWRFVVYKRWFDTGYAITSYVKFVIALFGLSSLNVSLTLILGFIYAVLCFVVGFLWFKYGFIEADTEIGNQYNPFVGEMREVIK